MIRYQLSQLQVKYTKAILFQNVGNASINSAICKSWNSWMQS